MFSTILSSAYSTALAASTAPVLALPESEPLVAALLLTLAAALSLLVPLISPTRIEWAEESWNPASGCTRVGPECDNCYMFTLVEDRLGWMNPRYTNGTEATIHPDKLGEPAKRFAPGRLFVNSMSDWLHESFPDQFVFETVEAMREAPWHLHMPLTKRGMRLAEFGPYIDWPECVMAGVSVGIRNQIERIDQLRESGARKTYVSFEPLLESVVADGGELDLTGIDLAIVGGESGDTERRMEKAWVLEIQEACERSGTAFFFKQWGRFNEAGEPVGKTRAGRVLNGRTWDEQPAWNDAFMRKAGLLASRARYALD